jgi:cardiolipin synthase
MMPHIPDKVYAYLLARTYYKQLLKYGVKIYEYTPGFVHAKLFVSDDIRASVGTINLDFRSLYLHFECSAYIYENDVVCDIENDYQETLLKCHEITLDDCRHYSGFKLAIGKILRLIAPLM